MTYAVNMARNILSTYWDRQLPIKPEDIAEALGVTVILDSDMEDTTSGSYSLDGDQPVIRVNANQHSNRQRFTLAHELGHHVLLHGEREDSPVTLFRQEGTTSNLEIEANAFAAELLMPKGVIDYVVENVTKPTIQYMAEQFWVSEQAMIYRLRNTGWL